MLSLDDARELHDCVHVCNKIGLSATHYAQQVLSAPGNPGGLRDLAKDYVAELHYGNHMPKHQALHGELSRRVRSHLALTHPGKLLRTSEGRVHIEEPRIHAAVAEVFGQMAGERARAVTPQPDLSHQPAIGEKSTAQPRRALSAEWQEWVAEQQAARNAYISVIMQKAGRGELGYGLEQLAHLRPSPSVRSQPRRGDDTRFSLLCDLAEMEIAFANLGV